MSFDQRTYKFFLISTKKHINKYVYKLAITPKWYNSISLFQNNFKYGIDNFAYNPPHFYATLC
jgi:hypothetical protein